MNKAKLTEELDDLYADSRDYLKQNYEDLLLMLDNKPAVGTKEFIDAGLLPDPTNNMPYDTTNKMLDVIDGNLSELMNKVQEMMIIWEQIKGGYEDDE